MAGDKDNDSKGVCGIQFTVEWAMWANINALYSAACKFS